MQISVLVDTLADIFREVEERVTFAWFSESLLFLSWLLGWVLLPSALSQVSLLFLSWLLGWVRLSIALSQVSILSNA